MRTISDSPKHVKCAKLLKSIRKEAGLTQAELSVRLTLSRETIVAIERCYLNSISTIHFDIMAKWCNVCAPRVSMKTREAFKKHVLNTFGFTAQDSPCETDI